MKKYETRSLKDRLADAAQAKRAALEKFKSMPGVDDPAAIERRREREAIATAREARTAERKRVRAESASEAARQTELAAQAVAEAQILATQHAQRAEAEQAAQNAQLKVEQKAARDARYAARKARQTGRT